MSLLPNTYVFDDILKQFTTEETVFLGGIEYLEKPELEGGTGRLYVGSMWHIDCSDFDYTSNISEATQLEKTMFTYPNGVKVCCGLYADQVGSGNDYIHFNVFTRTKAGVKFINQKLGYAIRSETSTAGICPAFYVKEYGFNIFMWTDYFDWSTVPIQNITRPKSVKFTAIFGIYDTQNMLNNNTGHQIRENSVVSIRYVENVPSIIDEDGLSPFLETFLTITDLDDFEAELKTYGDLPDDFFQPGRYDEPSNEYDPSGPGGGTGGYTGGGMGGYDNRSDPVDFPALPTGGALSTGTVKGFVVDAATITSMFLKLWDTSSFDISQFQKLLQDPLDALISLYCLPCTPKVGSSANIKLGNYDFDNAISAPVISNQYLTVDCGSIKVGEYYGNALDYDPYVKVEIFLPFIGIRPLKADDVVNQTVHVKYNVDVLTGDLSAQIKCGMSVLYKYQGNCKAIIPISARTSEVLANLIKGAGSVAAGALAGGLAGAGAAAISAAVNVALSKTEITRSGDLSGSVGLLDEFLPYLIIHRPIQSLPANFKTQKGYPSNITAVLSSIKGYTEVEYIHLTGISGATDTELEEIESLLKEGVLL